MTGWWREIWKWWQTCIYKLIYTSFLYNSVFYYCLSVFTKDKNQFKTSLYLVDENPILFYIQFNCNQVILIKHIKTWHYCLIPSRKYLFKGIQTSKYDFFCLFVCYQKYPVTILKLWPERRMCDAGDNYLWIIFV